MNTTGGDAAIDPGDAGAADQAPRCRRERSAAAARGPAPAMRGRISTSIGSSAITVRASTSSRIFIEPISAVIAEPERPAIMIEVSSTPSSRSTRMPIEVDRERRRAEARELEDALLRDDRADEEIDQQDDRRAAQREDLEMDRRSRSSASAGGRTSDGQADRNDAAEEIDAADEVGARRRRRFRRCRRAAKSASAARAARRSRPDDNGLL